MCHPIPLQVVERLLVALTLAPGNGSQLVRPPGVAGLASRCVLLIISNNALELIRRDDVDDSVDAAMM